MADKQKFGLRSIKFKTRLIKIWLMYASRAAQSQLLTSWSGILFLIGKLVRFFLYFIFLFTVMSSTKTLVGYNREQVVVFYLVFNLIEITSQCLFRGVYQFRSLVSSGDFDSDLLRPLPSFFRPIFGWTDILDLVTLPPLWIYFFWFISNNQLFPSFSNVLTFLLLFGNSLFLVFSFHLFFSSVSVLTTQVDPLVWIYRDLTMMARFPTDIYEKAIQLILTFIIPIIILITFPTKALMGLLSWQWMIFSFLLAVVFLAFSVSFWKYALKKYSSASS